MKLAAGPSFAVLLALAAVLATAACAPPIQRRLQTPPPPVEPRPEPVADPEPAVPPPGQPRPGEDAARQQRALELQYRGELAAALTQWRILRTLEPEDPGIQRQLAATRALIRHRVQDALAAGAEAEQAGDTARARTAYLQALALDPRNRDAFAKLRSLESAAVLSVQLARLDKLRTRRSRAAARKAAGQTDGAGAPFVENGNGQERDYRDMGIALFESGDYEASILELRKYLGSFPEDEAALDILRQAEKRASELDTQSELLSPPPPPASGDRQDSLQPASLPVGSPAVTAADAKASQDLYEQGVRVYRQDISEAIHLWEQSLERDPNHVQARLRLEQAHKMQRRLKIIDRE